MGEIHYLGADGLYVHAPSRRFGEAIRVCLRKYFTFSGRASRSEYWYFFLFAVLVGIATGILDALLFGIGFTSDPSGPTNNVSSLLLLLPSLTVAWRRLHDINRSGWWIGGMFLVFFAGGLLIPRFEDTVFAVPGLWAAVAVLVLAYSIVLLVFVVTRGDPRPNRFG